MEGATAGNTTNNQTTHNGQMPLNPPEWSAMVRKANVFLENLEGSISELQQHADTQEILELKAKGSELLDQIKSFIAQAEINEAKAEADDEEKRRTENKMLNKLCLLITNFKVELREKKLLAQPVQECSMRRVAITQEHIDQQKAYCTICCEDLQLGESPVRECVGCGSCFHWSCITDWLQARKWFRDKRCPNCNRYQEYNLAVNRNRNDDAGRHRMANANGANASGANTSGANASEANASGAITSNSTNSNTYNSGNSTFILPPGNNYVARQQAIQQARRNDAEEFDQMFDSLLISHTQRRN